MSRAKSVASWVGLLVFVLGAASGVAGAQEIRLPLEATEVDPGASGRVDFEVREDRVKLSIQVEDVTTATSVRFIVGGDDLGTLPIVAGIADLNLDSRLGDTVPEVTVETLVEVQNADTSAVILFRNGETEDGGDGEDGEPQELRLCLAPTDADPSASGKAVFEVRDDRTRLKIEVEDVSSAANVIFSVNGGDVGSAAVTLGIAVLRLDSRVGDTVPEVDVTSLIEVRNAATDELILSTLGAGDMCEFPEDNPDDGLEIEFELRAILFDEFGEARGHAKFRVKSRSGDSFFGTILHADLFKFSVQVEDLDPNTAYTIAINGTEVGTVTTDGLGNGEVVFTSRVEEINELPIPENFPAEINVGDIVTIGAVLTGEFVEEFEHGDLDHDGDVDDDDEDILSSLLGFVGVSAADLNGDGVVDQKDLTIFRGIGMPAGTLWSFLFAVTAILAVFAYGARRRRRVVRSRVRR